MSEIVDHLEAMARIWPSHGVGGTAAKAAAHIAALEAGVRRLQAALEHGCSRSTLFQICEEVLDTRAALAPAPVPAYVNKDGPCDRWAPGAYEVTAPAPAPDVPPMSQRIAAATSIAIMVREWYGEPITVMTHLPVNVIAKRLARFYPDAPAPAPEGE